MMDQKEAKLGQRRSPKCVQGQRRSPKCVYLCAFQIQKSREEKGKRGEADVEKAAPNHLQGF